MGETQLERVQTFLRSLDSESPRARALIQAGMLEELLRELILTQLAKNKSTQALFGPDSNQGLSMLAQFSHCLNLVDGGELSAIQCIGRVRNKFAHSWRTGYHQANIIKLCGCLGMTTLENAEALAEHQTAFYRFDFTATSLVFALANRIGSIEETGSVPKERLSRIVYDVATGNHVETFRTDD